MSFNYYLFDYDGTICNTFPTISYSLQKTFEISAVHVPDENAIMNAVSAGLTLHGTLQLLHPEGSQLNMDELEMMAKLYREVYLNNDDELTVLFDGAAEVFQKLKAAEKTIIVLSNKGIAAVEKSLRYLGLYEMADMVIAEGVWPELNLKAKPDPMIYETLIREKFRIQSGEEVLMTGDTYADILFSKNCGVAGCWAAYGYGQRAAVEGLGPDYTIERIADVLQLS